MYGINHAGKHGGPSVRIGLPTAWGHPVTGNPFRSTRTNFGSSATQMGRKLPQPFVNFSSCLGKAMRPLHPERKVTLSQGVVVMKTSTEGNPYLEQFDDGHGSIDGLYQYPEFRKKLSGICKHFRFDIFGVAYGQDDLFQEVCIKVFQSGKSF